VTVFQVYLQANHHNHFRLAPLTVRSTTYSQQPPERSVLSHAAWWGLFTTPDDHQRLEAIKVSVSVSAQRISLLCQS